MFVFGKLLRFLIHPLHMVLALVGIGLLLRAMGRKRAGDAFLWTAAGFVAVVSLTPLPNWLPYVIENRIEAGAYDIDDIAGVIVLGGAQGHGELAQEHGAYQINDAAERLTTAVALRLQRPDVPIIFSGGSGRLIVPDLREPEINRMFLTDMGVDPSTVEFEDRSRNTHENAVYTAEMIGDRPGRWLLVTSALHMPRALGCFRQAGVDVIPYPVDYRIGAPGWSPLLIQPWDRFADLDYAMNEIVGLVTYRILGRTDALFPDD